jgi:hypothetical protein
MIDARYVDSIFVRVGVFFFSERRCPLLLFCSLGMGALWVCKTLPWRLRLIAPHLHIKMSGSGTLQGGRVVLRVPVLFKAFRSRSYGASRGGWSGLHSRSVACPRAGHSALRLASHARVRRLDVAHLNSGSDLGASKHGRRTFQPGSSATWSGGFKRTGRCVASCRPGSTRPSPFSSRLRVSNGSKKKMRRTLG